ncbi:MAG: heme ABC exporter ATP-binding protein CcmA [Gemmatimonadales bacterium]
MLQAEGLGHAFGTPPALVRALDDVSFTLQPSQTLVVFGPNGAGKTTLLKVLAGLIRPGRGRVRIEGGRRAVGWIGHQPQLYGPLTVLENLRFWGSLYDLGAAERERRARELLRRLGIEEHGTRPVRALSRGLVQRVAIARALLHDPRVLLLDEPFTGLDRGAAAALRHLLAEHAAAGRATVLVTHNVEEGAELATHVAFLRAGRFVQLAPRAGRDAGAIAAAYRAAIGEGEAGEAPRA